MSDIPPPAGLLGDLTRARTARTARASSFDQTGRNRDNWIVMPGEERVLADLEGPGFITHIWMTQSCRIQPGPGQIDPAVVGGMSRRTQILRLLLRYRNSGVFSGLNLDPTVQAEVPADGNPEQFVRDLEALGPTFVKLGQMLSTRPDLVPPEFASALERMQEQVAPIPVERVREIFEDELGPLHIGRNITEYAWDGRDQFGDRLANGVYLYRVVTQINGDDIEHRETEADQYFKKGWGKMYLMR